MLIKSHEQLNQAVCETFFSSQLSKMGSYLCLYYHIENKMSIYSSCLLVIFIINIALLSFLHSEN